MPPTMEQTRPSSVKSKVRYTMPPRQVHVIFIPTHSPPHQPLGWFYVVDTDKSGQLDDAEIGRALAQANVTKPTTPLPGLGVE